MLENIKTGIPQFIEVSYLVWALINSFKLHGKNIIVEGSSSHKMIEDEYDKFKSAANAISALIGFFWVGIAYWGGTHGIWMYIYLITTMGLLGWSANWSKEKILSKKYNFYQALSVQLLFQIILFMGGFYTKTPPNIL